MDEAWKPVPGCPFYEMSDYGHLRSIAREVNGRAYRSVVIAPRPNNSGYVLLTLRDAEGARQTRTAHRLVLETFRGPCPPGQEARHPNYLTAGWQIMSKGACVQCHAIGALQPTGGAEVVNGPDLRQVAPRFRPGYLGEWLANLDFSGVPSRTTKRYQPKECLHVL